MKPKGQLAYHHSLLDAELQPLALCATDDGSEPLPLIVELSPGSIANLPGSVRRCEQLAGWAAAGGERCLVIKPGQRGSGSVGQGPAEVDVLEAIEWASQHFPVDPDRVSLMGGSMGGAATWYLASHYPDRFAAAAPFCGYADYQLWEKPGGHIMRTQDWERFSWESRGAAYRVENLTNMALWITHGQWDISIGGGVPVEHSRRISDRLTKLGVEHRFSEVPSCGHGCMTEQTGPPVVQWLCQQRRKSCPEEVRLVVHTLRHHRSFWVQVDQLEAYGQPGRVEARRQGPQVTVLTDNVCALSLGPIAAANSVTVTLDSTSFEKTDLSACAQSFAKTDGGWSAAAGRERVGKRHGASGPIGDLFFAPQRFVFGTGGSDHENFILDWLKSHLPDFWQKSNGGVHRGVFAGESWYELPVVTDTELSDDELRDSNLVLYGSPESNAIFRRFRDHVPVEVRGRGLKVAGRSFTGEHVGGMAVFPHPENPHRYLAVVTGNSPEALAGASHLNLQLLPDYLVWQGARAWWGFFGNDWR